MLERFVLPGLAGCILTLAIVLGGCGSTLAEQATPQASYAPLHIVLDADRLTLTKPEEMCNRMLVADVVVGAPIASRWNTADGKLPADVASKGAREVEKQGYFIYTIVSLSRMTPLRDGRQAPTQQFLTIGGQVGQDTYVVHEEPQLTPGVRYLAVFDHPTPVKGAPSGETMLLSFAYQIDGQGMILFQRAGNPNEPSDGGALQPEIKTSLTSLRELLAACKS